MDEKIKIGVIGQTIIDKFTLDLDPNTPIYRGTTNRSHMQNRHPDALEKYEVCIPLIIKSPQYVGINPKDGSLEYYRKFEGETICIKVAVRPSRYGVYYARTLYDVGEEKFYNYLADGHAKQVFPLTNQEGEL